MATLSRSLTVSTPLEQVAEFLSDLTTSPQWDPHTVRCRRLDDGPVAVGSRYEHTRGYQGFDVTIEMAVDSYEPLRHIAWSGGNAYATGREELRFDLAGAGGTVVTHTVDVELSGIARLGNAMLPAVMQRIADDGTETMRLALEQLAAHPDSR
jgi:carbon monoxide dehydrogenase subunit G